MSHVDDGQLNALLDGELTEEEALAVESHVAACAECRERLEEARRFLTAAGELLGLLDLPVVAAEAPGRSSKTAKELAISIEGAPRVSKTVKEKAVDVDARTQKSPAIRPVFPQQAERAVPERFVPERRGRPVIGPLAWAATVVLALGVGYLANEVWHLSRVRAGVALGPVTVQTDRASEGARPAAGLASGGAAASGAEAARGAAARPAAGTTRTRLVKPPTARGSKPPSGEEAARRVPRDRPPGALARQPTARPSPASAAGPATAAGPSTGALAATPPSSAATAGAGAGPAAARSDLGARDLAGAPAAPAAPRTAPAPAGTAPATPRTVPAPAADMRFARAAEAPRAEAPLTTFRRITMDEAVRRLSGSIRLIDGMQPAHVEVGPGRLVPGSSPDREVVRVYYADAAGQQLILDQQPGDSTAPGRAAPASVNGLMRGDTLVTSTPDGGVRVRWVDRRYFWLSLTGRMNPDSLRVLVERIR